MSGSKKKSPTEELIESLLQDVGEDSENNGNPLFPSEEKSSDDSDGEKLVLNPDEDDGYQLDEASIQDFLGGVRPGTAFGGNGFMMSNEKTAFVGKTRTNINQAQALESDVLGSSEAAPLVDLSEDLKVDESNTETFQLDDQPQALKETQEPEAFEASQQAESDYKSSAEFMADDALDKTNKLTDSELFGNDHVQSANKNEQFKNDYDNSGDGEKTVAVAGYQLRNDNYDDRVKVSVGQNYSSTSGYAVWSGAGSAESNLAQADNLRIAQEKILDLETENEKLRLQNEELLAASEIIKERSDLLSAQLSEYKNDRENLEDSFKNEVVLLKNHLSRKDSELQKALLKSEELESRLKFDMKKIRVRERELENRLELIRAEKNAVVKNKDEQILDLRRKMDVLHMEVESYRQKCVELNKNLETNQDSFKRTTRALRLAMANLELQEENKVPLKKAE